jgi:tetratricopeptide (TPR) repeat protein
MVSLVWLMGVMCACSPIRRIPAPDPPPTVLPPSVARGHYLRGQLLAAEGDLDGAEHSLARARMFDADEPRILMALGAVAMTRGDMDTARERLAQATALASDRPDPWLAYGRLELAFGDKDVGRDALRRAIELGDSWEARASLIADDLRDPRNAGIPPLLVRWSKMPVDDAVELRRRGDLRLMAGDAAGSVDDLLAAMNTSARDVSLVASVMRAATVGNRMADALIGAEQIVDSDPSALAAWMTVGLLSSLIDDHAQTVRAFEAAESLGADLGSGPRMSLGRARKALVRIEPTPLPGRAPNLGDPISRVLVLMEEQRWDEGERSVRQSLLIEPADPRLLYIMAQIYLERDGLAAATPWVDQVLDIDPNYAPALNLWAWIHAEQGLELNEAEGQVRRALQYQPRVGGYWDTLGWVLVQQGRHAEALPILERAVRLSPKDEDVRDHRDSCRGTLGGTGR